VPSGDAAGSARGQKQRKSRRKIGKTLPIAGKIDFYQSVIIESRHRKNT